MLNKVEICGVNTAKLGVLKNDEIMKLLEKCKQGDKAAREKLISGNLRLVLSVIQKFSSRNENVDDLFQIGCIGLIKAIDNFDMSQQVRFSTYGVPMTVSCRKTCFSTKGALDLWVSQSKIMNSRRLSLNSLKSKVFLCGRTLRAPPSRKTFCTAKERGQDFLTAKMLWRSFAP